MSKDIDYNVVMTTAKDVVTGHIYVLDYYRARCNPGELCSHIFEHVQRWRPVVVGYEDVAYQRSIEYWLKELMRQERTFFMLQPVKGRAGKDAKKRAISSLQPLFSSKTILLRSHMKELQSELLKFPLGDHDDLADALSMQLEFWRNVKTRRDEILNFKAKDDPLSFESGIESIRKRNTPSMLASIVFDPLRTFSSLELAPDFNR